MLNRRHGILQAVALIVWLCISLPASTAPAQTEKRGKTFSFPLSIEDKGSSFSVPLPARDVKFRKEPDFGNDKIKRFALTVGQQEDEFIGGAINITRRTLHLDLNRNLDLTDDPQGTYRSSSGGRYLSFSRIRINAGKNDHDRNYIISINAYELRGSLSFTEVRVNTSFRGNIQLNGQDWSLRVNDNLNGILDSQDQIHFTPGASSPSENPATYRALPGAKRIFIGGRSYDLNLRFLPGREPGSVSAEFTEIDAPMGELILDGKFIHRLVLAGEKNDIVLLESPSAMLQVPLGSYLVHSISLQGSDMSRLDLTQTGSLPWVTIKAGAQGHLKAGGPLESSLTAIPGGSVVRLNYLLKGVGGELYSASDLERSKPPRWTVHKGSRQIASGNFEFG